LTGLERHWRSSLASTRSGATNSAGVGRERELEPDHGPLELREIDEIGRGRARSPPSRRPAPRADRAVARDLDRDVAGLRGVHDHRGGLRPLARALAAARASADSRARGRAAPTRARPPARSDRRARGSRAAPLARGVQHAQIGELRTDRAPRRPAGRAGASGARLRAASRRCGPRRSRWARAARVRGDAGAETRRRAP
jgi:hypothetical protein